MRVAVFVIALAAVGVDPAIAASGPSPRGRVTVPQPAVRQTVAARDSQPQPVRLDAAIKSAVSALAPERAARRRVEKVAREGWRADGWRVILTADPRVWPPRLFADPFACTPGFTPLTRRHWWG